MNPVVEAAFIMMVIAVPLMFIVIGIFIGLTKMLVSLLPPTAEELEDN
ncbi:MAG: hypothetical protein KBA38_00410 [Negativicutes bacterium]|jgi:hypothetical protein|nr:hypothetical protein [Negativicutes bacterium]